MTTSQSARGGGEDTSAGALRAQYAALRQIPAWRRLQLTGELTVLAQNMAKEGLRRRNPDCTHEQLEVLYFEMVLGAELAAKVFEHRRARQAKELGVIDLPASAPKDAEQDPA